MDDDLNTLSIVIEATYQVKGKSSIVLRTLDHQIMSIKNVWYAPGVKKN